MRRLQRDHKEVGEVGRGPAYAQPPAEGHVWSAHLYRGCSDVSEGDRSGMERDVEDRVVAMEAVVASSKEGGVQGRRSGRPVARSGWALAGAWEASGLHLQLGSPSTTHAPYSHLPPHTVVPASFKWADVLQFPPGIRPSSSFPLLSN